jgi:hypothetical protein
MRASTGGQSAYGAGRRSAGSPRPVRQGPASGYGVCTALVCTTRGRARRARAQGTAQWAPKRSRVLLVQRRARRRGRERNGVVEVAGHEARKCVACVLLEYAGGLRAVVVRRSVEGLARARDRRAW